MPWQEREGKKQNILPSAGEDKNVRLMRIEEVPFSAFYCFIFCESITEISLADDEYDGDEEARAIMKAC